MLVNENNSMPYMKSLATCLNRMIEEGYAEDFKIGEAGLEALQHNRIYKPGDVHIITSFRFEGQSEENATVYVIETTDGLKGTVVDMHLSDTGDGVKRFIDAVENFQNNPTAC